VVAATVRVDGAVRGAAAIEISKLDVVAVAEFASVTRICIDRFSTLVGVPLTTPVEGLRLSPAGRVPLTKENDWVVAPPEALIGSEKAELNVPEGLGLGVAIDKIGDTVKLRWTRVAAINTEFPD
jgi:hypothetical protein